MSATDPRRVLSFTGIDYHGTTYKHGSTIVYDKAKAGGAADTMIGKAVSLSADGQVDLCQDADRIVGKLILVESDGYCTVQDQGFCELPAGASASVTVGKQIVGALGASSARGYIREAADTAAEANKSRGNIVNNDTTTAVVVQL